MMLPNPLASGIQRFFLPFRKNSMIRKARPDKSPVITEYILILSRIDNSSDSPRMFMVRVPVSGYTRMDRTAETAAMAATKSKNLNNYFIKNSF